MSVHWYQEETLFYISSLLMVAKHHTAITVIITTFHLIYWILNYDLILPQFQSPTLADIPLYALTLLLAIMRY
jgi:hypothetical protein